jgi:thiamine-phosphate pyrophosphorylase
MTSEDKRVARIIDVNTNRAVEGIRVMEEVARFVLENRSLTAGLKNMRSRLRRAVKRLLESGVCVKERNALADVGRKLYSRSEAKRSSIPDIFTANAKRVQEALRVLEEFSKLSQPAVGKEFKDIRFRMYALEKRGLNLLKRS